MTGVKICGLSQVEHALAAAGAGADCIGMVFAPGRRQVTVEKASEIVEALSKLSQRPRVVGVFVNAPATEVNRISRECRLDLAQLHGDETWDCCRDIELPVIKALHVSEDTTAGQVMAEIEKGHSLLLAKKPIIMLDSQVGGKSGGMGKTFDWKVAKEVSARYPIIVAGGLDASNVAQLIREVKPWGVDVSSGVETNGVKSVEKIRAFIQAVRLAEKEIRR